MNTIVQTTYGKLRGEDLGGICVWRGIPFAKPPVGNLRFMPPEAPEAWDGIRDALSFSAHAMQPRVNIDYVIGNHEHTNISEDCLYLNVWSGARENEKRPVMVWIHQGGFYAGDSYTEGYYDGSGFAEEGIVFVSIQYRLHAFGFLYLEDVSDGECHNANAGMLDQAMALKWVKDNISAFGGDPENITVFGQSAGAMSVSNLLVMPVTEGLFQKAIIESTADSALARETAVMHTKKFLEDIGISRADYRKLWDIPAEELTELSYRYPTLYFAPLSDGVVIPARQYDLLKQGAFHKVPVLIGSTKDEYNGFSDFIENFAEWTPEQMESILRNTLGAEWENVKGSEKIQTVTHQAFNNVMSDIMFNFPSIYQADLISSVCPVWMYKFSIGEAPKHISIHGADIVYVFNQKKDYGPYRIFPGTQDKAELMHTYCLNFARTGNPNGESLPVWETYEAKKRRTMVFTNETSSMEEDPFERRKMYYDIFSKPGYRAAF